MGLTDADVLARISALLGTLSQSENAEGMAATTGAYQGTLNLVGLVYGPQSRQEATLVEAMKALAWKVGLNFPTC
jgi:hypothetical protein